jgi:hypothetical protein
MEPALDHAHVGVFPYRINNSLMRDVLKQYSRKIASEGGRAREFYGFVALVSTFILWVAYVLWALCPDEWLTAVGVQWYPNRQAPWPMFLN